MNDNKNRFFHEYNEVLNYFNLKKENIKENSKLLFSILGHMQNENINLNKENLIHEIFLSICNNENRYDEFDDEIYDQCFETENPYNNYGYSNKKMYIRDKSSKFSESVLFNSNYIAGLIYFIVSFFLKILKYRMNSLDNEYFKIDIPNYKKKNRKLNYKVNYEKFLLSDMSNLDKNKLILDFQSYLSSKNSSDSFFEKLKKLFNIDENPSNYQIKFKDIRMIKSNNKNSLDFVTNEKILASVILKKYQDFYFNKQVCICKKLNLPDEITTICMNLHIKIFKQLLNRTKYSNSNRFIDNRKESDDNSLDFMEATLMELESFNEEYKDLSREKVLKQYSDENENLKRKNLSEYNQIYMGIRKGYSVENFQIAIVLYVIKNIYGLYNVPNLINLMQIHKERKNLTKNKPNENDSEPLLKNETIIEEIYNFILPLEKDELSKLHMNLPSFEFIISNLLQIIKNQKSLILPFNSEDFKKKLSDSTKQKLKKNFKDIVYSDTIKRQIDKKFEKVNELRKLARNKHAKKHVNNNVNSLPKIEINENNLNNKSNYNDLNNNSMENDILYNHSFPSINSKAIYSNPIKDKFNTLFECNDLPKFKSILNNYLLEEVNHYTDNLMKKTPKQLNKMKVILELPVDKYVKMRGDYSYKYEYYNSEGEILLAYCFQEIFEVRIMSLLRCIEIIEKIHKSE